MRQNKSNRYMPLLMALCVVIGILIGTFYANHFSGNRLNIINSGSNRLNNLLHIINDQYVDAVNIDSLVDKAIPQILADLDPHSTYISAKDVQRATDELKGSFSGVGIEFVIRKDTIRVQGVIKNGPAERAGIIAGDKIVSLDGKPFVGKTVTNEEAMHRLKGPKDTKVKIGVLRYREKKQRYFTVTRGDIPQKSVSAAYMLDDKTGYIRIKSFGDNTYPELLIALAQLSQEGFGNLVIDLRDNTGGYLQSAIQIANEFLPAKRLIVYTEGRRSFGKGLVQQQMSFNDGSMIRLTVARYYTPSGRCIQKPYVPGAERDYEDDLMTRYTHGEFFSQDSIKHTGPAYHTVLGRTVYGGGGITPDIFVPEDTTNVTSYYKEAAMSGMILQFAFTYTDDNRLKLNTFTEMMELSDYLVKQNTVEKFASFADKNGLQRRNLMIRKSHNLLERYINSRIIYNIMDEEAWIKYINSDDKVINTALDVFRRNAAFPKKPAPAGKGKNGKVALFRGTDIMSAPTGTEMTRQNILLKA